MTQWSDYDVMVIGGGHAGIEAASAAARMGRATLLLTQSLDTLGALSCNPAIGGIGKGHLVREIDALGGLMGTIADAAAIQGRLLNRRKGPAVRATRIQADRLTYRSVTHTAIFGQPNLQLFQDEAEALRVENGACRGVITRGGRVLRGKTVILTAGTFLAGRVHIGEKSYPAGRASDPAAARLAEHIRDLGLNMGRLKTGTPPRLDARTVQFDRLEAQKGESPLPRFGRFRPAPPPLRQVACHIAHTNPKTHEIIRDGIPCSPMYTGAIEGPGPRYCPSIEDKVVRFAHRDAHQIFLEPEGLDSMEIYPNGISTSLPLDVQIRAVQSIAGLEEARITRPGYAIEYDFLDPRSLHPWLEVRAVPGLFMAGQVNGTTGYEEAAAQGLIAGVNAALRCAESEPWYPMRHEAYTGVMLDDLVTTGLTEPYRMFTSRAEHRLGLREDNADLRLTPTARTLGLIDESRWAAFESFREDLEAERAYIHATRIYPNALSETEEDALGGTLRSPQSIAELMRRPSLGYRELVAIAGDDRRPPESVIEQLEVEARYAGYLERERAEAGRLRRYADVVIPQECDYEAIDGLSNEVRQRLIQQRPHTVGQASRLPGVTPAAVSLLLVHLRRRGWLRFPRTQEGEPG